MPKPQTCQVFVSIQPKTSLEQVKPDRFYLLSLRRYTDFIRDRISE